MKVLLSPRLLLLFHYLPLLFRALSISFFPPLHSLSHTLLQSLLIYATPSISILFLSTCQMNALLLLMSFVSVPLSRPRPSTFPHLSCTLFDKSVIYFHVAMVTLWAYGGSVPACQDLEKQRDQPSLRGRESG